jgi:hypothetical protein
MRKRPENVTREDRRRRRRRRRKKEKKKVGYVRRA